MTGPNIVRGWEGIARIVGVAEKSARNWALLSVDPLPVNKHRTKGVWAYVEALRAWDQRQSVPQPTAVELARLRRAM